MSNYRRFITYLFYYEDGEKRSQCGHARIEQRQNQGRIDFYIKDCDIDIEEVKPYFFSKQGEVQIPIGVMQAKKNVTEGSFVFGCNPMGNTEHRFSQMSGLFIRLGENKMIVSQWEDDGVDWKQLLNVGNEGLQASADRKHEMEKEEKLPLQNQSLAMPDSVRPPMEELEYQLCSLRQKQYPFRGNLTDWAIQAQLRDIRLLPKGYWKLANNSFVLRGYFNYGSILIGYMYAEKKYFIGIPGIFHKQEKAIAGIFGFEHFRGQRSVEGKPGDFGYWYQLIDVV